MSTTTFPNSAFETAQAKQGQASATGAVAGATVRDPRLDFFRGLAMFIILIAHTPGNYLTLWIPARFGFSDATEIFVFCSGMASAIAFGKVFETRGWWLGTARVAYRVWQVYWAHICMFFVIAMLMAALDASGLFTKNYIASLNLKHFFFKDTAAQLVGLFTLTYVPNYFDILPMYLAILAMMPIVVALKRVHPAAAFGAIGLVWLAANLNVLQLPAEPWSKREWFFNPFGWQLVFFTGFAFMRGWIPAPPVNRNLVIAAAVIVVLTIPVAWFRARGWDDSGVLKMIYKDVSGLRNKTDFGIFRYIHFLAVGYLAWVSVGEAGHRLIATGNNLRSAIWDRTVAIIQKVGQQSLAVFLMSMVMGRVLGVMLDVIGRSWSSVFVVNLFGFAVLIATAYLVAWFKSQPWRKRA
ncbi:MAG: OpgC domain-containing protein [Pseudomonadota bacterium]